MCIVYNDDIAEIEYVCEDDDLGRELYYDLFFEDTYYDFCWHMRHDKVDDPAAVAKMAYENTSDWYGYYMLIFTGEDIMKIS